MILCRRSPVLNNLDTDVIRKSTFFVLIHFSLLPHRKNVELKEPANIEKFTKRNRSDEENIKISSFWIGVRLTYFFVVLFVDILASQFNFF